MTRNLRAVPTTLKQESYLQVASDGEEYPGVGGVKGWQQDGL